MAEERTNSGLGGRGSRTLHPKSSAGCETLAIPADSGAYVVAFKSCVSNKLMADNRFNHPAATRLRHHISIQLSSNPREGTIGALADVSRLVDSNRRWDLTCAFVCRDVVSHQHDIKKIRQRIRLVTWYIFWSRPFGVMSHLFQQSWWVGASAQAAVTSVAGVGTEFLPGVC